MNKDNHSQEALHIEIDRSELAPYVKPGLAGHEWRQQGPYLMCSSCPLRHGTYVGTGVILTGFDEQGLPLLKRMR